MARIPAPSTGPIGTRPIVGPKPPPRATRNDPLAPRTGPIGTRPIVGPKPIGTQPVTGGEEGGARAYLQQVLGEYDLEDLTDWAYDLWARGYQIEYILAELRNQPAFADRFPAIAARRAAGLPPISPAEYIATERAFDQYMHAAGLTGMFDRKNLYTRWISGDVSPAEAKSRVEAAHQAVMAEPLEVRQEMQRMFGIAAGPAAIAYFLDPANAVPLIQSQIRQSQIGGAAIRSMFGVLDQTEAEELDRLGVDATQAQQGFGDLARSRELMAPLPGEVGENIGRDEQIDAQFAGNVVAQERIERQRSRRRAAADGGSRYRLGQEGVIGLGDSSQ